MLNHDEFTRDGILARCQCGAPIFLEEVLAALNPVVLSRISRFGLGSGRFS